MSFKISPLTNAIKNSDHKDYCGYDAIFPGAIPCKETDDDPPLVIIL
jgi:hypothetical protein